MLYQFKEVMKNQFNAGSKAVFDARLIAEKFGAITVNVFRMTDSDFKFLPKWVNRLMGWILWNVQKPGVARKLGNGGWLFVQHPITTSRSLLNSRAGRDFVLSVKRKKGMKIVALLHDVDEARYGSGEAPNGDASTATIFGMADKVIVHNDTMRKMLVGRGYPAEKMTTLGIFDYLSDAPLSKPAPGSFRRVVFAGNLRPDKCGFLSRIPELGDIKWQLFGKKVDGATLSFQQVEYGGCLPPDELPLHLTDGFGLVWDGDTVDGCGGKFGEYLRINNPHKCSLYLAAGLPVIVWKESALAPFVEKHGVGLSVGSLRELEPKLNAMSESDYMNLRHNAMALSAKLRAGEFLSAALRQAVGTEETAI